MSAIINSPVASFSQHYAIYLRNNLGLKIEINEETLCQLKTDESQAHLLKDVVPYKKEINHYDQL